MDLPHRMPIKALFAYTICFLCLIPIIKGADPIFFDVDCPNATLSTTSTYTANSTYHTNLNTLLSTLASNTNSSIGFYNSTATGSGGPPDAAYGLFICRGDLPTADCRECVTYAVGDVVKRCPRSKRVTIYYSECILRYSNETIFSVSDTSFKVVLSTPESPTNATSFSEALGTVMDDISLRASSAESGKKKFATGELNTTSLYTSLQTLYGLAQCTPDLSRSDCYTCLRTGISEFRSCCEALIGATVMFPSCQLQYQTYLFFSPGFGAPPPPSSPALPPPPSSITTTKSSPAKGGVSLKVIIAIIVPTAVSILLFVGGFCFVTRRAKKKYNFIKDTNGGDDISTVQSLQYDLGTIQAATNKFSDDNKIGEGGFGPVYKGLLPNGQEVAVKRLSRTSGQGAVEFNNEVVLIAKLQHRNLVSLLGFCLEGEEKILIYEFVPNGSLNHILFNPQAQSKLDWTTRFKIIGGIARGMLYLHEESRITIIHRDLKVSNILLDGDMNAKVSDFGMARIFGVDQTQGNTSRVAGTFGYMSPEYIRHGRYSTKSDVFSFGVLVLEIISGKKNSNFYQSNGAADLLSYARKLWRDGTSLDLMDPTLEGSYSRNEVTTCVHIALLCVQDDPYVRPSMATVVLMLNSGSVTWANLQQPELLGRSKMGSSISKNFESDQSTSKSIHWSVNEASITELDPR